MCQNKTKKLQKTPRVLVYRNLWIAVPPKCSSFRRRVGTNVRKRYVKIAGGVQAYGGYSYPQITVGVTDPGETELNIGECEAHELNLSTTGWSNYLYSLTINTNDFCGDPIIPHKSAMEHISKVNSIWISLVSNNLLQL